MGSPPPGKLFCWNVCAFGLCPFSMFSIAHSYVLLSTADIFHRWPSWESIRALQYRWPCQQVGQFILCWLASFWGHLGCYHVISVVTNNSRTSYPQRRPGLFNATWGNRSGEQSCEVQQREVGKANVSFEFSGKLLHGKWSCILVMEIWFFP